MLNWIEINRDALIQNVGQFYTLIGNKDAAAFVLKSNAYGHGLKEIWNVLKSEDPSWLCTNYVSEAKMLRVLGYKKRLLVVGPFVPDDIETAHAFDMELFLGYQEGLSSWLQAPRKPKIHIEFDTGMSRQGFPSSQARDVAEQLLPFKEFVTGVCMHFANVEDVTEHFYADHQLEEFEKAFTEFSTRGFKCLKHAASSASTLILDSSRFDLCRVGISLYGFWPSQATKISYAQLHGKNALNLKPVLSWKTKITSINHVAAGQYIGYGCTFKARKNMTVAVIPVGYYEGYPRISSGSPAYVLIHGERCPIVGRICMNMMMVDASEVENLNVGDLTTLIGQDRNEYLSASDVASWAQTIHYELVTRLPSEIPRNIV